MKRLVLGAAIGTAVGFLLERLGVTQRAPAPAPPPPAWNPPPDPTPSAAAEVDPDELTSPGTVSDPDLEEQRAREAAERERESRLSDETKFDELREQERERDAAQIVGDLPEPRDE